MPRGVYEHKKNLKKSNNEIKKIQRRKQTENDVVLFCTTALDTGKIYHFDKVQEMFLASEITKEMLMNVLTEVMVYVLKKQGNAEEINFSIYPKSVGWGKNHKRIYERICDICFKPYKGCGIYCCSRKCSAIRTQRMKKG